MSVTQLDSFEERLDGPGGVTLQLRCWSHPAPEALALIVHGLAEHSGRYRETGAELAKLGYACWAIDCRGHGRSSGLRGHVDSFDEYLADVAALRRRARAARPGLATLLLGHSQGGLIALLSALAEPSGLDGLALTSPLLAPHPSLRLAPPLHRLALWAARFAPRLRLPTGLDPRWISRRPEVVAAYRSDPLVFRRASLGWYTALQAALERAWDRASALSVPTWIASAGADRLVDADAHRRWAARAPAGLVRTDERPGQFHELLNEPERGELRGALDAWFRDRLRQLP